MLDFLETTRYVNMCRTVGVRQDENISYKREQKVSIEFATALVKRTVRQTLVKTLLLHSEFGIKAGRFKRSRRPCHRMKASIRATLPTSRTMFTGWRMLSTESDNVLHASEHVEIEIGERSLRKDIRGYRQARGNHKSAHPIYLIPELREDRTLDHRIMW